MTTQLVIRQHFADLSEAPDNKVEPPPDEKDVVETLLAVLSALSVVFTEGKKKLFVLFRKQLFVSFAPRKRR